MADPLDTTTDAATDAAPRIVTALHWGQPVRFAVANPDDLIQAHHARGEFYEPEELEIIRQHCRFGAVFCDIGSNVGNHSLYVGLFLRPAAIIPFEVNPAAVAVLRANLAANGLEGVCDLTHLGIGLADREGRAGALRQPAGNLGGTRVTGREGAIPLARGDDLLAGRRADFLKIDVEGMEMGVLAGLAATIAAHRPRIFVEVDDVNAAAMQDWIAAQDYTIADRFRRYVGNENLMLVAQDDPDRLARRAHLRKLRRRLVLAGQIQEGNDA